MPAELQCIHYNFGLFLPILGVTLATDFLLILRHKQSSLCSFLIFPLLPFHILRPCYGMDVAIRSKVTRNSKLHFLGLPNGRRPLSFSSTLFNPYPANVENMVSS